MREWIELTDNGEHFTCEMPADETVIEVRLTDGEVTPAFYACNIMDAGDYDFVPVDADGEPLEDGDSLADKVVAWRHIEPTSAPSAAAE